jgi:hypothetical protein
MAEEERKREGGIPAAVLVLELQAAGHKVGWGDFHSTTQLQDRQRTT